MTGTLTLQRLGGALLFAAPGGTGVDVLSGTAGAGADLDRSIKQAENGNKLVPYNEVGHRHTYEVEQELSKLAGSRVCVHFTPVYVPIVR